MRKKRIDLTPLLQRVKSKINEHSLMQRFEEEIEALDLLEFLKVQADRWKFYWSSRNKDFEYAAYSKVSHYEGSSKRPFQSFPSYAFCSFDKKRALFVLPRFEITRKNKIYLFACHFRGSEKERVEEYFSELVLDIPEKIELSIPLSYRSQLIPNIDAWRRRIDKAKQLFKEKQLEKIVLARQALLKFDDSLNPYDLLRKLKFATPACFHFLFSRQKSCAFIGASPELLFERRGSQIKSEAVAGTRPSGKQYREELLTCPKELKEHNYVVKHLRRSFHRICQTWKGSADVSILERKHWQHLYYEIEGVLRQGYCDGQIFSILHPTPAVATYPFDFSKLKEIEGFDRGLYAGALGCRSRSCAEFAVAIRSAYVFPKSLLLFSGAGIVEESHFHAEWEEINLKITNFLELFSQT